MRLPCPAIDSRQLPSVIGTCVHCLLPLYAWAPVAQGLLLAHVGCEVDAHRQSARLDG